MLDWTHELDTGLTFDFAYHITFIQSEESSWVTGLRLINCFRYMAAGLLPNSCPEINEQYVDRFAPKRGD